MRKMSYLLGAALLISSCTSYREFSGAAAGGSLGGIFGSAIGGLIGGPRGSDAGTAIGVIAGAAIGSQAAKDRSETRPTRSDDYGREERTYDGDLQYGRMEERASGNQWNAIEVSNIRFYDTNDNRALDAGEQAYIEMNIYNNGSTTLYDVAPLITTDTKRIRISPSAIIAKIEPGRGVLYRATVVGDERLKNGEARFAVSFGKTRNVVKQFRIHTQR